MNASRLICMFVAMLLTATDASADKEKGLWISHKVDQADRGSQHAGCASPPLWRLESGRG